MNSKAVIGIVVGVAIAVGIGIVVALEGESSTETIELNEEGVEFTDTTEIAEPEVESNETQNKSVRIELKETMSMEGK